MTPDIQIMAGDKPPKFSKHSIKIDDLLEITRNMFKDFLRSDSGDVTNWLDILRTSRQPQILWEVDYIKPRKEMSEIKDFIQQTIDILYEKDSIILKKSFFAKLDQQAAFNTIRAHLLAESDPERAKQLFLDMLNMFYDDLSLIRKSNLLYHSCLSLLCCNEFIKSYDCFERHWALLKYATPCDRIKQGIIDNHLILQLVYWFFIKHVEDFRDFYSIRTKVDMENIWNHKKIALLYFMQYDCSYVVSCCGLPFYEYAKNNFPTLPKYEHKRSTPTNMIKTWDPDDVSIHTENVIVGEEKYYFEQFNREIDLNRHFPDFDKTDDHFYSYYHYQNDYIKDRDNKLKLTQFISKYIDLDIIKSVVELGCGLQKMPGFNSKNYVGIEISQKICDILEDRNLIQFVHASADKFMTETRSYFDLCGACDLLNHLRPQRLKLLLGSCSNKCKYLAASIDTQADIRSDIFSTHQQIRSTNVHRTMKTHEEWIALLKEYFKVEYEIEDAWLFVFCDLRQGKPYGNLCAK